MPGSWATGLSGRGLDQEVDPRSFRPDLTERTYFPYLRPRREFPARWAREGAGKPVDGPRHAWENGVPTGRPGLARHQRGEADTDDRTAPVPARRGTAPVPA
ncbi:hypothetical protein GCM10028793_14050 [Nocardiopsis oceani]